jgi:membrane protease subunit HflK
MSWNEPGNNKKDPWSGREQPSGPPDLDEVIKGLQEKLTGLFGGGSSSGAGGGGQASGQLAGLVGSLPWDSGA